MQETIKVHLAEHLGEGYWADYPPYEFDTLDAARVFAVMQVEGGMKLRDVTSNVRTIDWKEWF